MYVARRRETEISDLAHKTITRSYVKFAFTKSMNKFLGSKINVFKKPRVYVGIDLNHNASTNSIGSLIEAVI